MWGYEAAVSAVEKSASSSYESPCGVMSYNKGSSMSAAKQLRIPMWGYEGNSNTAAGLQTLVTNPHVGL